jgi:hypothetical protein
LALQFRRRKQLLPGLTLNASRSGLGVRIGPKGAGVSLSPAGTRVSGSIPGTGLSATKRISGRGSPRGWGVWVVIAAAVVTVAVIAMLIWQG